MSHKRDAEEVKDHQLDRLRPVELQRAAAKPELPGSAPEVRKPHSKSHSTTLRTKTQPVYVYLCF